MANSKEFMNIVNRIIPGQPERYYEDLYDDTWEFINKNINGEGSELRHSHYYSVIWRCAGCPEHSRFRNKGGTEANGSSDLNDYD